MEKKNEKKSTAYFFKSESKFHTNNILRKIKKSKKYLLICIFSIFIFSTLYFTSFSNHRIRVFISFMLFPALVLIITKEKLNLGKVNKKFFISIFVYFLLFLWVIAYYPSNKDFFSNFDLRNESIIYLIKWNITIFLHVSTIDFFTKRIVQYKAALVFGDKNGFIVQLFVWMIAHIYEFFWIKDLMGNVGSFLFLFASGFLTGFIYMKTKDIIGLMIGHWLLNFLVMLSFYFI